MPQLYSQRKAFSAIVEAALRSILKSPSSVIFTIAFPLVFILVFGFLGNVGDKEIKIALAPDVDTSSRIYQQVKQHPGVQVLHLDTEDSIRDYLLKGKIDLLLNMKKIEDGKISIDIQAGPGAEAASEELKGILENVTLAGDPVLRSRVDALIEIEQHSVGGSAFQTIDFILPGQLGFSLLAASVFGTAFVFFTLRQGLVLKRFFATPVRKQYILLAEGVARMVFQLLGALLIILIGKLFLGFTLAHGVVTVMNMLVLSAIGILVFMSFGFIVSGVAKNESTIPPLANILTLPQFLLAGTFFPIDSFPAWMQPVSRALPLTYLNDALREVAFEGASLWAVRVEVIVLLVWGIVGYLIASRLFKWE